MFDIRLLATGEEKIEGAILCFNAVEEKLVKLLTIFNRALVQSVNNNVVLSVRVLTKEAEESVGKDLDTRLLSAAVTGLVKQPGDFREVLNLIAQLPDETLKQGVKLLDILIAEVEVVISKTGVKLSVVQFFDMIDDG